MKRKWSWKIGSFAVLSLLASLLGGGCDTPSPTQCPAAFNWYACYVNLTPSPACTASCGSTAPVSDRQTICAATAYNAYIQTVEYYAALGQTATPSQPTPSNLWDCQSLYNNHPRAVPPVHAKAPPPHPEDLPSCDPTSGDNACVACAKASCCSDYQACSNDANCLCWVSCKAGGGTDTSCASSSQCGTLDAVSSSAAACLDANCAAECGTMTTGAAGGCTCPSDMGSSSNGGASASSSGSTSTCTPGSSGPGESCFSDGDCTSCECDPQTMTCA
jgi:hypothetical protein